MKSQINACTAVIVAAGTASRMRGIDKMLAPLNGQPVLLRTVRALAASSRIGQIIIVTRDDLSASVRALCGGEKKVCAVVLGGATRAESVLNGLRRVKTPVVAIHDGARPLVTPEVIDTAISAAEKTGAAAPAVPVRDTIKIAEDGMVRATPDRAALYAVQTPQVFATERIRAALADALEKALPLTDDCSAAEAAGLPVALTAGSEENIKITTPIDLVLAEAILRRRETT